MKRICKGKAGFTLVEVIIVIAIIAILASVLAIAVAGYLQKANTVKKAVSSNQASFSDKNKKINSNFIDLGY